MTERLLSREKSRMALAVYDGCYSFEEGGIEAYTPQEGEGC